MIKIGLLGLGTVGTGVYRLIQAHKEQLESQLGCSIKIEKILVRKIDKKREIKIDNSILTTEAADILGNSAIDLVIEVMGSKEVSYNYIRQALEQGQTVITANKDVIADNGRELHEVAYRHQADLFYEASVAGGIPVIRGLVEGLASDKVYKLMGIVNGTTNYILTKMYDQGLAYDFALKKAQELGFAEPDPTSDVEGLDSARKMTILASLAFSMGISMDDVYIKGISGVTAEDIEAIKALGYTIKLIGYAGIENESVEVSVQPTLLPLDHSLAAVKDEYNAVSIFANAVGETMFYGPGAGSMPTAMAIVSDVIRAVKNQRLGVKGKSYWKPNVPHKLKTAADIRSKFFLRLRVKDEVGVLRDITQVFAKHQVSFESVMQTSVEIEGQAIIVLIVHQASVNHFMRALKEVEDLAVVDRIESYYRVEEK